MRQAVIGSTTRTPISTACRGAKYALCTTCVGRGQVAASLLEVV